MGGCVMKLLAEAEMNIWAAQRADGRCQMALVSVKAKATPKLKKEWI